MKHRYSEWWFAILLLKCSSLLFLWCCQKWKLYNVTGEVWLKTYSCLISLSWKTTCLERPQNSVVAFYRFHCISCYSGTCMIRPEKSNKTHKFQHLTGTVFTKSCLFSLSWETTCLERPQNSVVTLYRFHCIICYHPYWYVCCISWRWKYWT